MDNLQILKAINKRINSNELSAYLSASDPSDATISEDGLNEITAQIEGLLTVDSAVTNKAVKDQLFPLHKKTILNDVEGELKTIAEKIGVESFEGTVFDKIRTIDSGLESFKGADNNDLVKSYQKQINELNEQINVINETKNQELSSIKQGFENERIKQSFLNKINSYKLADAYDKDQIKKPLINGIYDKITATAKLKLVDGDLKPFDKELDEKPFYVDNKEASLEDLLNAELQDFIKVSDPTPAVNPQIPRMPATEQYPANTIAGEMRQSRGH